MAERPYTKRAIVILTGIYVVVFSAMWLGGAVEILAMPFGVAVLATMQIVIFLVGLDLIWMVFSPPSNDWRKSADNVSESETGLASILMRQFMDMFDADALPPNMLHLIQSWKDDIGISPERVVVIRHDKSPDGSVEWVDNQTGVRIVSDK